MPSPVAKGPPMTTRQAKRLGKKQVGQFQFTASQLRRADREEEMEKREKKRQEQEERKAANKRKREEQAEKQRAAKRRMLEEGKISIEDTWERVTRSQSRLHSYFTAPPVTSTSTALKEQKVKRGVKSPATMPVMTDERVTGEDKDQTQQAAKTKNEILLDADEEDKENHPQDLQTDGLADNCLPLHPPIAKNENDYDHEKGERMVDCQRLKDDVQPSRSQQWQQETPPLSCPRRNPPKSAAVSNRTASNNSTSTVRTSSSGSSTSSHGASLKTAAIDAEEKEELLSLMAKLEDDIIIAEDETAGASGNIETEPLSMPQHSCRSALSEMSVANVNTRAQEKPDTTSVPEASGLATPSKPRDPFAGFNSGDFDDDDDIYSNKIDELTWDKENADPLHICTPKAKAKVKASAGPEKAEAGPSSYAKRLLAPQSPSCKQDNFEDIFDEDFDTGDDDGFADDGIDDETLMSLSTQRPQPAYSDRFVDDRGSPQRLVAANNAVSPGTAMPAPISRPSKAAAAMANPSPVDRRGKESMSFSSVCDEELLDFVQKVEVELNQESGAGAGAAPGKGKERASAKGKERAVQPASPPQQQTTTTTTAKQDLLPPGEKSPAQQLPPPPSTQYYLQLMADDISNDRVFG